MFSLGPRTSTTAAAAVRTNTRPILPADDSDGDDYQIPVPKQQARRRAVILDEMDDAFEEEDDGGGEDENESQDEHEEEDLMGDLDDDLVNLPEDELMQALGLEVCFPQTLPMYFLKLIAFRLPRLSTAIAGPIPAL